MTKPPYPASYSHVIAIIGLWSLGFLSGCALLSGETPTLTDKNPRPKAHKLIIVNESDKIVSAIQYKPCGSEDTHYKHLTGNLRPNERLTINIYSQCVDMLATNAFKKKLVHMENLNLNQIKTWNIK